MLKFSGLSRLLFILLIVVANIGCDQAAKSYVRQNVEQHASISLIDEHFLLTNVENSGAFLSAGDDLPPVVKTVVLTAIPVAMLVMMFFWLFFQSSMDKQLTFAMSSILGGGIGNIFDRVAYGSVTDFFFIDLGWAHTGVFNLADVSISGGVVMALWILFKQNGNKKLAT